MAVGTENTNQPVELCCRECGCQDIVGYDRVTAFARISGWVLGSDGTPVPTWGGGSTVDWDSQTAVHADRPYWCNECGRSMGHDGLKPVEVEKDEADGEQVPGFEDYSFHFGGDDYKGDALHGLWWWSVTVDYWSGIETSDGFATRAEAEADARRHLKDEFGKH